MGIVMTPDRQIEIIKAVKLKPDDLCIIFFEPGVIQAQNLPAVPEGYPNVVFIATLDVDGLKPMVLSKKELKDFQETGHLPKPKLRAVGPVQ